MRSFFSPGWSSTLLYMGPWNERTNTEVKKVKQVWNYTPFFFPFSCSFFTVCPEAKPIPEDWLTQMWRREFWLFFGGVASSLVLVCFLLAQSEQVTTGKPRQATYSHMAHTARSLAARGVCDVCCCCFFPCKKKGEKVEQIRVPGPCVVSAHWPLGIYRVNSGLGSAAD